MMKKWELYDGEKIEGVSTVEAESKEDALLSMCEMLNNDSEVYNYVVTTSTKARFRMVMSLLEYMT